MLATLQTVFVHLERLTHFFRKIKASSQPEANSVPLDQLFQQYQEETEQAQAYQTAIHKMFSPYGLAWTEIPGGQNVMTIIEIISINGKVVTRQPCAEIRKAETGLEIKLARIREDGATILQVASNDGPNKTLTEYTPEQTNGRPPAPIILKLFQKGILHFQDPASSLGPELHLRIDPWGIRLLHKPPSALRLEEITGEETCIRQIAIDFSNEFTDKNY